jgi:hypothetical protein
MTTNFTFGFTKKACAIRGGVEDHPIEKRSSYFSVSHFSV